MPRTCAGSVPANARGTERATKFLPPLNAGRINWLHDPAAVASSSEPDSDSSNEPNVTPDQVHLVLTRNELALVLSGLRQYGRLPLVERLEQLLVNMRR